jgi:hypothetical protein
VRATKTVVTTELTEKLGIVTVSFAILITIRAMLSA